MFVSFVFAYVQQLLQLRYLSMLVDVREIIKIWQLSLHRKSM